MAAQINYRVNAILQTKGALAAQMAKKAEAVSGFGAKLDAVSGKLRAFGGGMAASAYGTGAAFAKAGLMGGGAAVGAGVGFIAAKGFEANASMERMTNTVAGTLQLFNHSAGAADQLGTNVKVAASALRSLNKIADESPGELRDVQMLFQNMLPGARAATGSMQRILDMTQNAALFTPTFGGDFAMVGSQLSRMMTGGAGAEMEVWRTLSPVLLEAGKNMNKLGSSSKIFEKNLEGGEKATMAFNKLAKEDRLRLLETGFAKGGPALAKMYEQSWEGASATMISGWRKVASASTLPMFTSIKAAVIKATRGENAILGKSQMARFEHAGETIGLLLEKPLMRGVAALEGVVTYLDQNWKMVANTVYHAFQYGEAAIKGAFAFGVTKLLSGLALAGAGGLFGSVTRGVGMFRKGLATTRPMATKAGDAVSGFFAALSFGSSTLFKFTTTALPSMLGLAFAIVPLIAVAGLAVVAFGGLFVVVGGIAAYITSKWAEISTSIRQGFESGAVTMRPLVVAALTLWERLKLVGQAFIGGMTGATMMQSAINFAAMAVEWLTSGVALLIEAAAMFIDFAAKVADTWKAITDPGSFTSDFAKTSQRAAEIMQKDGVTDSRIAFRAAQERERANVYGDASFADRARKTAESLRAASRTMSDGGLKNLDFESVEKLTKKADDWAKDLFSGDTADKKTAKGHTTNIGTLNMNVDLREKDPDRLMRGLFEPLQQLALAPTSSNYDGPGF